MVNDHNCECSVCAERYKLLRGHAQRPLWLPIDDKARDGREILLRQGIDGPIFAGYFGLANLAFGAGASTMYPWTILDNTNGVNHMCDGGETGITHYCAFTSTERASSGVMDAAAKASERVSEWSDAKKDYANRVTAPVASTDRCEGK